MACCYAGSSTLIIVRFITRDGRGLIHLVCWHWEAILSKAFSSQYQLSSANRAASQSKPPPHFNLQVLALVFVSQPH